ncbi:MAG: hypothetical protein GY910_17325 [bacterium]|nr:hypothetical protein [bacterium]
MGRLVERGGALRTVFATAAELRWLTWDDIELENALVQIRAKLDWRPKTHVERTVQIPASLVEQLDRHRSEVASNESDWVFPVPCHGGQ